MNEYITKDLAMQEKNEKIDFEIIVNELKEKYHPKKSDSLKHMRWALELGLISEKRALGSLDSSGNQHGGIENCGKKLKFALNRDKTKRYMYDARFCRWRFCPMCNWRLSLKRGFVNAVVMKRLAKLGYRFIFVTLTIPNVAKDELGNTIAELGAGWQRLIKRKKYKDFIVGGIRNVEVTYNKKRDDYHPHLHVICCVKPEYFKCVRVGSGSDRERIYPNMIDFETWQKDWQSAIKNPRAEQIWVKAVSQSERLFHKAALEISKYVVKDSDMGESPDVFEGFVKGLKGKRLFNPFGVMSELHNEFLKHPEDFHDCFNPRQPEDWFWKYIARWNFKENIYENGFFELTDEEIIKVQKKFSGNLKKEDLEDRD